jgi:hypothetical protein
VMQAAPLLICGITILAKKRLHYGIWQRILGMLARAGSGETVVWLSRWIKFFHSGKLLTS